MTITVTQSAKDYFNKICSDPEVAAVYLTVTGGGCAGFGYDWSTLTTKQIDQQDTIINCGEGLLVVSAQALPYVEGVEIDFITELLGTKLVINNPNAVAACGCGESVGF
jgi:iron-sulfur cluster assembly accessory protein